LFTLSDLGAFFLNSGSESLLLLEESDDDVPELSAFGPGSLVGSCSGSESESESESELESLEDDPEDDVSSPSNCSEKLVELDAEVLEDS